MLVFHAADAFNYPFACGILTEFDDPSYSVIATAGNDARGTYASGKICELLHNNTRQAAILYHRAAVAGHYNAIIHHVRLNLPNPCIERMYWLCLLHNVDVHDPLNTEISTTSDRALIYYVGTHSKHYSTGLFASNQDRCARSAVDTWSLCAKHLGFYRDLIKFIGHLVWTARIEANYQI